MRTWIVRLSNRLNADNSPFGIPGPAPEFIAVIAGLRRLDHLVSKTLSR
jgi:hypothetical protein